MFDNVSKIPDDPILSLMAEYNKNPSSKKISLSVGLYFDENGFIPQLKCVKQALSNNSSEAQSYLPIDGNPNYCQAVQNLLFGDINNNTSHEKIITVQTLGGSGALRLGADFLKSVFTHSEVWLSNPSWENHHAIFESVKFSINSYPYYCSSSHGLDFENMCASFNSLKPQSIVILQACGHNPTGVDLSTTQWEVIISIIKKRKLIPFIDCAYLGLVENFEKDVLPIQKMAAANIDFLVANSFSKNMSLYDKRIGSLSIVTQNPNQKEAILSQLKALIRRNYSNPPAYGANIVNTILANSDLQHIWRNELLSMREYIVSIRNKLFNALKRRQPDKNWDYLKSQQGMFSYTGLSEKQVTFLKEQYSIYMLSSGRISITGLNDNNIDYFADQFANCETVSLNN